MMVFVCATGDLFLNRTLFASALSDTAQPGLAGEWEMVAMDDKVAIAMTRAADQAAATIGASGSTLHFSRSDRERIWATGQRAIVVAATLDEVQFDGESS